MMNVELSALEEKNKQESNLMKKKEPMPIAVKSKNWRERWAESGKKMSASARKELEQKRREEAARRQRECRAKSLPQLRRQTKRRMQRGKESRGKCESLSLFISAQRLLYIFYIL